MKVLYLCAVVVVVLSVIFVRLLKQSGITSGEFTYEQGDSLSQLYLYPDFYETLARKYNNKIIISDTFTSAPINAVSSNYIFTHRPWTGGADNRYITAKRIMSNPISAEAISNICGYKIDLIAINLGGAPRIIQNEFSKYSWLMDDFRPTVPIDVINTAKGYRFVRMYNGIALYEIDRSFLCR